MTTPAHAAMEKAMALFNEGKKHNTTGNYAMAYNCLEQALQQFKTLQQWPEYCRALNLLGNIIMNRGDNEGALVKYGEALALAQSIGYGHGIHSSHISMGIAYGNTDKRELALHHFGQALELARKEGTKTDISVAQTNMGVMLERQGDYALALQHYMEAHRLMEETGAGERLNGTALAIGSIYQRLEQWDDALKNFELAMQLSKQYQHTILLAQSHIGIGSVHLQRKNCAAALQHFKEALQLKRRIGERLGEAHALALIGRTFKEMHCYEDALQYLQETLQIQLQVGSIGQASKVLEIIGTVYMAKGMNNEAEEHLLQALQLAEKAAHRANQADVLNQLYQLTKLNGAFARALQYHEQYIALKNELSNADTAQKIAGLKFEHQLELKEKETTLIESILHNILPRPIAARIKAGHTDIIEKFDSATVLFADIAGFTAWSAKMDVKQLADELNKFITAFDELAVQYGVEKIKTIGDGYMCVAGLPEPCTDHAVKIADMALGMQKAMQRLSNGAMQLRIGIHTGEVIAGVIGKNKYTYDLWGDTVNTASRMESHALNGTIQVTRQTQLLLQNSFTLQQRGAIEVKGKGVMQTWWLVGRR